MYEKIVETIKKFLEETPTTIDNVSYIYYIKELQSELVEEKKRVQLHKLSNYVFSLTYFLAEIENHSLSSKIGKRKMLADFCCTSVARGLIE